MPEETIDPGLLEQTKTQIRKLVAEISELAESDIQPNEFYGEFLNRVVAAVAASGGALWLTDGRGGIRLQQQLEFHLSGLLDVGATCFALDDHTVTSSDGGGTRPVAGRVVALDPVVGVAVQVGLTEDVAP